MLVAPPAAADVHSSPPLPRALLSVLDLHQPGKVSQADWERGCEALYIPDLDVDNAWRMLSRGRDESGEEPVVLDSEDHDVPLQPHVHCLLRVIVQTLVRLSERCNTTLGYVQPHTQAKKMRSMLGLWKVRRIEVASSACRRADTRGFYLSGEPSTPHLERMEVFD